MKKRYFITGFFAAVVLAILLGAAFPAPIWRNNFSTNEPPYPVIGDWTYSNTTATATNTVTWVGSQIGGFRAQGNGGLWNLYGWGPNNVAFDWNGGQSALFTNGAASINVQDPTVSPLRVSGVAAQVAPLIAVQDPSAAFNLGTFRTNAFWATTNDFFATLQTTDNTTNNILTLTMRDNSVARCVVDVVGYNSTSSASYGKIGTFKSVAGTVTQVGSTATVGQGEDDAAYECILDTSANVVRVRVAGNTAKTVNWKCYLKTIYSE